LFCFYFKTIITFVIDEIFLTKHFLKSLKDFLDFNSNKYQFFLSDQILQDFLIQTKSKKSLFYYQKRRLKKNKFFFYFINIT